MLYKHSAVLLEIQTVHFFLDPRWEKNVGNETQ